MDVLTGTFVQQGSPAFFLLLVVAAVVALVLWKKFDKAGFNAAFAAVKAEIYELEERVKTSAPEFKASLEADLAKAKARLEALLSK